MSSGPLKTLAPILSLEIETYGQDLLETSSSSSATCAWCRFPFTRHSPPVLLKSGHRVHIDCYYELQRPSSGPPN